MIEKIRSNNPLRFYEFDIFRVLACISIILTHLIYVYPVGIKLDSIFYFLGTCGLTIFFFFSGFFIAKYPLDNNVTIRKFWKGRFRRLIPALYVAIFFYCIVEALNIGSTDWDIPLNLWSILSNMLCLQVFFYQLRFFAMWYVGALLFMYLIHTCIRKIVLDNVVYYILLFFLFFPFVVMLMYVKLPIYGFEFEPRVIEYYFVFMVGTISGMIMQREGLKEIFYPAIIFFFLIGIKIIFYFFGLNNLIFHPFNLPLFLTLSGLIIFILLIKKHFYIPMQSIPKFIMMGSYASYSAYLLHYPVICILALTGIQNLCVFAVLSVLLVFLTGYLLQTLVDTIFDKKRLFHSSIVPKIRNP